MLMRCWTVCVSVLRLRRAAKHYLTTCMRVQIMSTRNGATQSLGGAFSWTLNSWLDALESGRMMLRGCNMLHAVSAVLTSATTKQHTQVPLHRRRRIYPFPDNANMQPNRVAVDTAAPRPVLFGISSREKAHHKCAGRIMVVTARHVSDDAFGAEPADTGRRKYVKCTSLIKYTSSSDKPLMVAPWAPTPPPPEGPPGTVFQTAAPPLRLGPPPQRQAAVDAWALPVDRLQS